MKKGAILLVIVMLISTFGYTQSLENLDYVSPFHDEVAAIKKGGQWAFINERGKIVINFRDDIVTTKSNDVSYPIFKINRCLIAKQKEGVSYFGYIDKTGKTVIEPQFLNATNFNNNEAIVLELIKENVGQNEVLVKNVVYYRYYEAIIDTNGDIKTYLNPKGVNVVLDKKFLRKPPHFKSKILSDHLYAILNENNKWAIIKINDTIPSK